MREQELEKLQSERLVKVVKKVYDNVEIYRKKMDAAGVKPEGNFNIQIIDIQISLFLF